MLKKYSFMISVFIMAAVALTGCSVAQRVPDGYLTQNYIAAPTSASTAPQEAETSSGNQTRTYATPEKPKTGKPPKAVVATAPAPGASVSSSASSSAVSSSTSSEALKTTNYNKAAQTDDKQEVLGNVEISGADIILKNKYIKGDLVVKDGTYGTLTLEDCKIDGKLTVNGDLDTIELIDVTANSLYLYSGAKITVNLEGDSAIMGTYLKGTDAALYAYNIGNSYSGYSVITIERSAPFTTKLEVHGAKCETVIVDSESEVILDDGTMLTRVRRFIANNTITIFGAEQIDVLNANAKNITLHGQPGKIIYDDKQFPAPVIIDP
ncbi:hypothetical protein [Acetanaerobacterium elongatum]|uniref:Polymer-forming protein n=1 Tax=Acetanaerobacterium elongatum TaxID=258515 RepID=A0A1G9VMD7_9FIRM|nr:hypothetical protein [Acetanaerobacterium elongatum]SDM73191.1 hypothetical protein SAMN05192585_10444 [Acetanaerobacterium elongatum]